MKVIRNTNRMSLVQLDSSSCELVVAYFRRNRVFLEPWEMVRDESFFTANFHAELLEKEMKLFEDGQLFKGKVGEFSSVPRKHNATLNYYLRSPALFYSSDIALQPARDRYESKRRLPRNSDSFYGSDWGAFPFLG